MWGRRSTDLAQILTLLGGLLILLEGLILASAYFSVLFALGAGVGLILLAAGVLLGLRPRNRTVLGLVIVAFSILSFYGDSGYLLGAVLGLLGGIIAVVSRGLPYSRLSGASRQSFSLGAPCPRCGKPVPSWTSTCPYCRYPGS
jgi:hypothetical protein